MVGAIYVRSPEAGRDLDQIFLWIAREASEARAIKVLQRLEAKFQMIADFPGLGRPRDVPGQRLGASEPPWIIFYEPLAHRAGVRILRVLDGRRDLTAAWERADR
jgi:toxin ParE1/3/4